MNVLDIRTREEFRRWLSDHYDKETEVWIVAGKGKNPPGDCIQRDKKKDRAVFEKRLRKLIDHSAVGNMYGDWNDYGRLLNY